MTTPNKFKSTVTRPFTPLHLFQYITKAVGQHFKTYITNTHPSLIMLFSSFHQKILCETPDF